MKKAPRLRFQKGDWLAVLSVLALSALVFLMCLPGKQASEASSVRLIVNGKPHAEFSLSENRQYRFEGSYPLTVNIRDGEVWVTDSACPGADCAHTGKISSPASSIICLPNKLEIVISGESAVDLTVR